MVCTSKHVGSMQRSKEDEGMKQKGETPREELGSKIQKQRRIEYTTFQKWQRDLDRELQTMSWIDCISENEGSKKIVVKLRCKVCTEFEDRIRSRKHFSDKCIVAANSIRVSNIRDHATCH